MRAFIVSVVLSLSLSLIALGCSGDSPSPLSPDAAQYEDQGLVYHDTVTYYDGLTPDGASPDIGGVEDHGASSEGTIVGDHGAASEGVIKVDGGGTHDLFSHVDGAMSCVKGTFVGCQGETLIRCDDQGSPINISCSPFTCNITEQRCNECEPTSPNSCSGAYSISCGSDGLVAGKTSCKLGCDKTTGLCTGCVPKTYYHDGDGDTYGDPAVSVTACSTIAGYVAGKTDCDDADKNAHPTQTAYFSVPTKGTKDFDFNCDGSETKRWTKVAVCVKGCGNIGWTSTIPGCGKAAPWSACKKLGSFNLCIPVSAGSHVQECH